jgi:hypothetical protein
MFKIGDEVICIDNSGHPYYVDCAAIYRVKWVVDTYIQIEGSEGTFKTWRFRKLTKLEEALR